MRRVALMVLLSIASAAGADKDSGRFTPGPASSYPGHQTIDKITIAAVPFVSDDQAKTAFGKVNPYKYGVLPVLLIFENGTGNSLRLDLKTEFIYPDGKHLEAIPPDDVQHLGGVLKPPTIGGPTSPIPLPRRSSKGPLNIPEIQTRAFAPRMLPVGESAYGFFYFEALHLAGSRLYLTGIKDAKSGQDYFYFEVPLQK